MENRRLFINYRTSDTRLTASALGRELARRFGKESVFIDYDRIEGGEKWPERLRNEVELATAMLCLIGENWIGVLDSESKRRRLDMEEDWVRCEIRRALERNIPVIPVLVEKAELPARKDLPEVLAQLANLQARHLRSGVEWENDVDRILNDLGFSSSDPRETFVPGSPRSGKSSFVSWRQDVRQYLNLLITTMSELNRTSSVASLDPYIDLAAEQREAQPSNEIEYPRDRGHLVSIPQIRPAITEIVGALGRPQSVTAASDIIGIETKTVRSVLNVLRKRSDPLVLLGEPGSGKSTTLRELVIQLARHALIFPSSPIPIYVELGRFRERIDRDPNKTIVQLICDAVPPGVTNLRQHLVNGEITTPVVVVFDGMDEIPRLGDYADRTAALASFATDYQAIARTVFACRTNDFNSSFGHQQLVLQPFDERRVRLFLRKTLGKRFKIEDEPQTPRSAARRLMQVDELGAEAANPLTLSLAVHFISKHGKWPRGRAALFEEHLVALADKALRRQNDNRPKDEQLRATVDAWAELAYEIFRHHGSVFMERMALEDRVGNASVTRAIGGGLVVEDLENGLLKFRHHRLQEFLVARRLHLPDPPRPDWSSILTSPRWQETLLNYFAIGGRNSEALTVILDSLRPAQEYFKRLRPIVARSERAITTAQEAYDAIQPDVLHPGVHGASYYTYSDEQKAKKDAAQKRLEAVRRRHRRLRTLPSHSEMAWSDHVIFAARVCALLKPSRAETPSLYDPIHQTISGMLEFGRPAAQVRTLLAWRESAEWCPASVLDPVRNSTLDWVRSQTIHALASTSLQDRMDRAFSEELERELLNLNLFAQLPVFWKNAPLRPGRQLQVMFAAIIHLVFILIVMGMVAATGAFVAQRLDQVIATNVSPTLFWIAWLGLIGVVIVLTVPILRWPLITRVATANAVAGAVILGILSLATAGRLEGPAVWTILLPRLEVILTTLAAPLITTIALLSVAMITRLVFRIVAGRRSYEPGNNPSLRSFKVSAQAMQIGGITLLIGVVAAILASLDAPWFKYVGLSLLGLAGVTATGFFIFLLGTLFRSRWNDHRAKPVPKRIGLIATETLLAVGTLGLMVGIVALIGEIVGGVSNLLAGLIKAPVRALVPAWLPAILLMIVLIIGVLALVSFIAYFFVYLIGTYVLGAFGQTFWEIRYLVFRRRLQSHPYRGNLGEWETAFREAENLRRRELLDSFDHRAIGVAPQDALKTLHRLEEFVELDDPAAEVFHKTMYKLQEAMRQQRWVDPGDSR